jgi:hypothetical protein
MKLTIVETEIQEAIRNHIQNIIAVKPGMAITMDFSATRGSDGLIANIDISPAKDDADPATIVQAKSSDEQVSVRARTPEVTPATAQEPTKAAAPPVTPRTGVFRRPAAEPVEPKADPEAEAVLTAEAAAEVEAETHHADATTTTVAGVEEEKSDIEGDRPLARSIFSNLKRPTSDTAANDGEAA